MPTNLASFPALKMPVPGLTANARKKKGAKKRPSKRDITSEMEKENAAVIPDSANMNDSPDPQDGEHHNKRPRLTPGGSPLEKDGKAINEKKRSAPSPIIQKAGGNKNAAKRRVLQTIPGSDALGTGKGADGPDAGGGAEDENPTALEFGRASGGTGGLNQMAGRKRTGVQLRQCPLVAINIPKPKAATPRPQPSGTVKTSLLAHAEELLKAKDATVTLDSSDDEEDVSEPPSNQGAGTERDIAAAPVASALAGTSVTADKGGAGSKKASKMNAPASQATDAPVQGRGSNGIENASRAQNRNHSLDAQKINTVSNVRGGLKSTKEDVEIDILQGESVSKAQPALLHRVHVQYGKLLDKYKQLEAEKFGKIEEAFELQRQRVASYTEAAERLVQFHKEEAERVTGLAEEADLLNLLERTRELEQKNSLLQFMLEDEKALVSDLEDQNYHMARICRELEQTLWEAKEREKALQISLEDALSRLAELEEAHANSNMPPGQGQRSTRFISGGGKDAPMAAAEAAKAASHAPQFPMVQPTSSEHSQRRVVPGNPQGEPQAPVARGEIVAAASSVPASGTGRGACVLTPPVCQLSAQCPPLMAASLPPACAASPKAPLAVRIPEPKGAQHSTGQGYQGTVGPIDRQGTAVNNGVGLTAVEGKAGSQSASMLPLAGSGIPSRLGVATRASKGSTAVAIDLNSKEAARPACSSSDPNKSTAIVESDTLGAHQRVAVVAAGDQMLRREESAFQSPALALNASLAKESHQRPTGGQGITKLANGANLGNEKEASWVHGDRTTSILVCGGNDGPSASQAHLLQKQEGRSCAAAGRETVKSARDEKSPQVSPMARGQASVQAALGVPTDPHACVDGASGKVALAHTRTPLAAKARTDEASAIADVAGVSSQQGQLLEEGSTEGAIARPEPDGDEGSKTMTPTNSRTLTPANLFKVPEVATQGLGSKAIGVKTAGTSGKDLRDGSNLDVGEMKEGVQEESRPEQVFKGDQRASENTGRGREEQELRKALKDSQDSLTSHKGFLGLMEEAEVNSEDENEPQSLAAWQRWVGALPGITSRVGGLASGSTIPTMVFTHGASGFRFELGPVPSKAVAGEEEEHVEYSFEVNKGEESPEAHIEELYFCCQSVGALTGDLPSWIEEDEDGICFTADMAKKLIMELERILSSQIFDQQ